MVQRCRCDPDTQRPFAPRTGPVDYEAARRPRLALIDVYFGCRFGSPRLVVEGPRRCVHPLWMNLGLRVLCSQTTATGFRLPGVRISTVFGDVSTQFLAVGSVLVLC